MLTSQDDAKSTTVKNWSAETFAQFSPSVVARLDAIYDWAEMHYDKGQWILETMTPIEILCQFDTIGEARRYCKRIREQEMEARNA